MAELPADIRAAIADRIRAWPELGGLRTVATHPGRFDVAEIQRLGAAAPCILISLLRARDFRTEAGDLEATCELVAWIVAADAPGIPRDVAAQALVLALGARLPEERWGGLGVERPTRTDAQNLYSGQLDQKGVSLWGVAWSQRLALGAADSLSGLADFLRFAADYDLPPHDGAADASDLVTLPQEAP